MTQRTFPPAADLAQDAEPEYPLEALQEGDVGKAAEDAWRDKVLIWGRKGWAQNRRVCLWAVDMKMPLPKDYCVAK